jgi:hypothetical protein
MGAQLPVKIYTSIPDKFSEEYQLNEPQTVRHNHPQFSIAKMSVNPRFLTLPAKIRLKFNYEAYKDMERQYE